MTAHGTLFLPEIWYFMPKKSKSTIYDVAKKAGVSRQTVSRVLNNRQDVSAETRLRIQNIIEEIGYRPNAIAQSLGRQRSNVLGVVTAGLKYIGPSRTLSGITAKAEELGNGLLIKELASFNANNVKPILQWFQSHQVDGIIWAAPEIENNRDWIDSILPEINIPIIFISMEKNKSVSIVTIDNFSGAKTATEHLLSLGLNNIGHLSGPLDWWEARQRKLGWEAALTEANIDLSSHMCVEGNWSSRSGKSAFVELSDKYPEMEGLFVSNDQMALGAMSAALEKGIKIPDDLAIIGFDGIAESEFYCPALSTMNQNQNELGCIAVDVLIGEIEKKLLADEVFSPKYIEIKPELIIRRSSQILKRR
ncbi:MAG: LacI family transcriptional regulator [Chloroflexi bacterium]|nr:LacI family transcriptional regulator [Chloroflexota bacterium]